MKRDLLLVLGILLSTASQLRPAGAPILAAITTQLFGLTIFTIFHVRIGRHPIFLLAIPMSLVAAESRQLSLTRRWS